MDCSQWICCRQIWTHFEYVEGRGILSTPPLHTQRHTLWATERLWNRRGKFLPTKFVLKVVAAIAAATWKNLNENFLVGKRRAVPCYCSTFGYLRFLSLNTCLLLLLLLHQQRTREQVKEWKRLRNPSHQTPFRPRKLVALHMNVFEMKRENKQQQQQLIPSAHFDVKTWMWKHFKSTHYSVIRWIRTERNDDSSEKKKKTFDENAKMKNGRRHALVHFWDDTLSLVIRL